MTNSLSFKPGAVVTAQSDCLLYFRRPFTYLKTEVEEVFAGSRLLLLGFEDSYIANFDISVVKVLSSSGRVGFMYAFSLWDEDEIEAERERRRNEKDHAG